MFEEKAQRISEAAIALKDEAANAWDNVNSPRNTIQEIVNEEAAQEALKATMALSLAEARLQVAVDSLEAAKGRKSDLEYESGGEESNILRKDEEAVLSFEEPKSLSSDSDQENGKISLESSKDTEIDSEKSKKMVQTKKQDLQKDLMREGSPFNAPKALLKKSSRFFSASYFFSDGTEFTPVIPFPWIAFYTNRVERINQLFLQPDIITAGIDEVSSNTKPLIRQIRKLPKRVKKLMEMIPHMCLKFPCLLCLPSEPITEEEASLFDMSRLLFASVIYVPIFQKIPGDKFGMVHIGLAWLLQKDDIQNLSLERLSSMKKYVFGLGSAQVLVTAVVVGLVSRFIAGQPSPAAIIIGNGLALSSTAVVLQVTVNEQLSPFSVLLSRYLCGLRNYVDLGCYDDLAVVVLLILTPLISPNSSTGGLEVGFQAIAEPLGLAAVKAIVAITAIIAGGPLRPIYKQVAENQNAEIFSANTLLVILGPSLLTARAGLSMTLGAFLADIAPYRGFLLGLFFMMVGMSIDPKLVVSNFPVIMGTLPLLIGGKTILVALAGRLFGISIISAIRVGLLLAPGGEFAFVAFGEAVNQIELDCFPSHGGLYQ
ncbi:hypothetical protein LOK49_LG02G00368 [Camellia lanceoleosa]|uniref:Uncharacterized protein n=1 Tax=Camellia lanceoleosa TaxID=1840588 RepID=A0ACC0IJY1_9ERIC|nr:hypothetical protein LOK49_LG02G00368 [Camellia lanceoleosa]